MLTRRTPTAPGSTPATPGPPWEASTLLEVSPTATELLATGPAGAQTLAGPAATVKATLARLWV